MTGQIPGESRATRDGWQLCKNTDESVRLEAMRMREEEVRERRDHGYHGNLSLHVGTFTQLKLQ